jgi:hypothetical protein
LVGQNFPFETFLRGPIAGVPTSSVVAQRGQHVVDFVLDAPDGVRGVRDVLVLAIENGGGGGGPSAQWWWGGGHLVTKPLVVGGRNEEWIGHVVTCFRWKVESGPSRRPEFVVSKIIFDLRFAPGTVNELSTMTATQLRSSMKCTCTKNQKNRVVIIELDTTTK